MSYVEELFGLAGRTAIVMGASRGIGRAVADALTQAGANVVGTGRTSGIDDTRFDYVCCDARDTAAFADVCVAAASRYGPIRCYVHVAGISLDADPARPLEAFTRTLETNLTAAYASCSTVAPFLARAGGGSIVTVASINALQAFPGNPGYVASKGGLRMLTKALALDLGPDNIRVNCVLPGYVHTDMTQRSYDDEARQRARTERTILRRWGEPRDLVGAVIFLASDASAYMTGQDLVVDGGWTAKGL